MRYQYPAPNPLGHYWEEQTVSVWGVRLRLPQKTGHFFSYLIGEVVFANIFLLFELMFSHALLISLRQSIIRVASRVRIGEGAKRVIDVSGAIIGLILSLPFWIFLPILIKLDSRGPVFYRQERVGLNRRRRNRRVVSIEGEERRAMTDRRQRAGYGKTFMIIKFRSMYQNAEQATGPVWAQKNDSRITRIGRILRATRLDELPQLINVIKGNMSLVGPRPERPFFVQDLDGKVKNYTARFNVKPGITGLAQVEHKYDESIEDVSKKITYDLKYIHSWNVFQDIKIIMRTVVVVLTARGM